MQNTFKHFVAVFKRFMLSPVITIKNFSVAYAFLFAFFYAEAKPVYIPPYSAVVIDANTGKTIYEENAHQLVCPASLTKMMTLLLTFEALENGRLSANQAIKISRHANKQAPSKLGLRPGTKILVKDAILALITKSANDIAAALAAAIAGSEEHFAQLMTQKARSIGMTNTTFENASGLPASGQKTTAMDMAKLSLHLIKKYPKYYKLFSTKNFAYSGRRHRNHNNLLWSKRCNVHYDGIKTGYIKSSGFNLAASAVRDNRRMIAVVMGGKTQQARDERVNLLLQAAFDNKFFIKDYKNNAPEHKFAEKGDSIAQLITVSLKSGDSNPEDKKKLTDSSDSEKSKSVYKHKKQTSKNLSQKHPKTLKTKRKKKKHPQKSI